MSDILADIDDTLADWNGSRDSMHWTPDGGHEPEPFPVDLDRLWRQIDDVREVSGPPHQSWRLDPDVWPQFDHVLDLNGTLRLQPGDTICIDMGDQVEVLRVIEGPLFGPWRVRPTAGRPSKLDARYHQRLKNRRKRRH